MVQKPAGPFESDNQITSFLAMKNTTVPVMQPHIVAAQKMRAFGGKVII
jgi:hypothetical protein